MLKHSLLTDGRIPAVRARLERLFQGTRSHWREFHRGTYTSLHPADVEVGVP